MSTPTIVHAQRELVEGLKSIRVFAETLATSKIDLTDKTLRAGLDDIRIHAQRLLDAHAPDGDDGK